MTDRASDFDTRMAARAGARFRVRLAWRTEFEGAVLAESTAANLAEVGWTDEDTRRMGVWARRAVVEESRAYLDPGGPVRMPPLGVIGSDLTTFVASLLWAGLSRDDAADWVEVYLGCPDRDTAHGLAAVVSGGSLPVVEWATRLGPVGPLAWAAGLSIAEAEARRAVGSPTRDALCTLAGLRGWRLAEMGGAPPMG